MDIKCLIDTNIFIQLEEAEDDGWLKKSFAEFATLYHKYGIKIFVHEASLQDIERDKDNERKKKTLQALQKYPQLEHSPKTDKATLETLFGGINKSNDLVDTHLLYALRENAVHYLISEDDGVHKRGRFAGINERVFSIREFTTQIRRLFEPASVTIPHVDDKPVYSIDKAAPMLGSLREDYKGFDKWFNDCCTEGRKAWIVNVGDQIGGLCIYKDETGGCEFEMPGPKILKLCTFKVSEEYRGSKLGELLLKTAFLYAVENNYNSVYLTVFTRHEYFLEFLKDFGFQIHSKQNSRGEFIFYKTFNPAPTGEPRVDALDYHIKYAPNFYDDESIEKYVIPIQPNFHDILFPEIAHQTSLPLMSANQTVPGNSIKKVYLSNSKITKLRRGDVILFYRSQDHQEITTVGVVEKVTRTTDFSNALRSVGKRSVYSLGEIQQMANRSVLIVDFRLVRHLKDPLRFAVLKKTGVLKGAPQSILKVPHDRYSRVAAHVKTG